MTILDHIRSATRQHHQQIEAELDLMRPDLTLTGYIRYLRRSFGFYVPWEAGMAAALPAGVGARLALWPRAAALASDLRHLQQEPETLSLACAADLPSLASLPQAMGSLYVVEGSALGGQLIAKHVKATLRLGEEACQFLTAYGKQTALHWRAFCRWLEESSTPDQADIIARSACDTFDAMRVWLRGEPSGVQSTTPRT